MPVIDGGPCILPIYWIIWQKFFYFVLWLSLVAQNRLGS